MSRSTKAKIWTQGSGGKARPAAKRGAQKAIRNKPADEAPAPGSAYKKEFNSWDICDVKIPDTQRKRSGWK